MNPQIRRIPEEEAELRDLVLEAVWTSLQLGEPDERVMTFRIVDDGEGGVSLLREFSAEKSQRLE